MNCCCWTKGTGNYNLKNGEYIFRVFRGELKKKIGWPTGRKALNGIHAKTARKEGNKKGPFAG